MVNNSQWSQWHSVYLYYRLHFWYFRTIFVHGYAVDGDGLKMSKSLGNVVNPQDIVYGGQNLEKQPTYGVDTLRLAWSLVLLSMYNSLVLKFHGSMVIFSLITSFHGSLLSLISSLVLIFSMYLLTILFYHFPSFFLNDIWVLNFLFLSNVHLNPLFLASTTMF